MILSQMGSFYSSHVDYEGTMIKALRTVFEESQTKINYLSREKAGPVSMIRHGDRGVHG